MTLTSATLKVQQASGGIVSPPTGGEIEHYDSVTSQVSGNEFGGVNQNLTCPSTSGTTCPASGRKRSSR